MNRFLVAIFVALVLVSPALAGQISNGDFEAVNGSVFSDWDYVNFWDETGIGGSPSTLSVISGNTSARLNPGDGPARNPISQYPVDALTDWSFSVDFAFLGDDERSANFLLDYTSSFAERINISVGLNGQIQAHQTGTGGGWKNIGTLTALGTVDTGTLDAWDGETPVVNHLQVDGFFSGPSPYYNVTLNGVTVENLTYNQNGAPATGNYVHRVQLTSYAESLVDNVSFTAAAVPEPGVLVMLIGGLLAGIFIVRRK